MQHDRRIFADGVQHDRVIKLRRHLTKDMHALSLKALEMREGIGIPFLRGRLTTTGLHVFLSIPQSGAQTAQCGFFSTVCSVQ